MKTIANDWERLETHLLPSALRGRIPQKSNTFTKHLFSSHARGSPLQVSAKMLLTDKVRVELPTDRELEPIDIFADAAASLFPDEFVNSHGEAGATIVYKRFQSGEIRLNVSDPAKNDERQLFAHYLWNASIYSADQIEHGTWTVKGQRVLELGAGIS